MIYEAADQLWCLAINYVPDEGTCSRCINLKHTPRILTAVISMLNNDLATDRVDKTDAGGK